LTNHKEVRWGILGAARIAIERVIPAMIESKSSKIVGIASRSEEKAKSVAEDFNIPHVYTSYEDLLGDPEIDAVYLPLPNHLHAKWTIRAAEAGKHVLCEKPAALTEQETAKMVAACQANGVVFMEAFAFRCHPEWERIKGLLDSGNIGNIRNVKARFSINVESEDDIRLNPQTGGGVLYDLGSYCINAIRLIMGEEPSEIISMSQLDSNHKVDLATAAIMKFSNGRLAGFDCTFEGEYNQTLEITGTEGIIKINWPFRNPSLTIIKNGKEERMAYEIQSNSYAAQIEHFCSCILTNQLPTVSVEDSIMNMKVIESIYKTIKPALNQK
jgi:D-xylose 1-dehydrogenase (NADP+, D-xylono-1,5-lactone-forming)